MTKRLKKYKWRNGARTKGDAQACGERIEQISGRGPATPRVVLDDAREPSSPLHSAFEWDNSVAAEAHRLHQARMLLGDLVINVIVVSDGHQVPVPVRAFHVATTTMGGDGYYSLERVQSSEEIHEQVVAHALEEAEEWAQRYALYMELGPVRDAIRKVKSKHAKGNGARKDTPAPEARV